MIIKPLPSDAPDDPSLREHFAYLAREGIFGTWGERMIDLLDYLESESEAPPQWAHIRGIDLVLAEQDIDYKGRVLISPYPRKTGMQSYKFLVCYRLAKPWRFGEGVADDAVSAGELVLDGLKRAVKFEQD